MKTIFSRTFLPVLFLMGLLPFLFSCTKAEEQKNPPVAWNGVCSAQFHQDYTNLLNMDHNDKALAQQCDLFYQLYPDIKCLTEIDSVEVRVHTFDFDEKCNKWDFQDFKNKKNTPPSSSANPSEDNSKNPKLIPRCQENLLSYYAKTLSLFELNKNLIISTKKNEVVFSKALSSFRQCNQFFHIYKYSVCTDIDETQRSYYELKPYCDYFKNKLLNLYQKYPNKYFPEEFNPLMQMKLRMNINDPFIEFYKSQKLVNKIIVQGKTIDNNPENKTKDHCYFISLNYLSSEKLIDQEFMISEIIKEAASLWRFNLYIGQKSLSLYCRASRYLYLQDLKEILGGKVHLYTD